MSLSYRLLSSTASCSKRSRGFGFTAIELLVVIAIAAVLVSLALPSFNSVVARYRVTRASEDMNATIFFARSEAMKRGGNVTLRKSPDTAGCGTSTIQEWSCGWFVFVDMNSNGVLDAGDGPILRTTTVPTRVDVMTYGGSGGSFAFLSFDRWGRAANLGVGIGNINFQSSNFSAGTTKLICLSSGGRVRTLTDVAPPCSS